MQRLVRLMRRLAFATPVYTGYGTPSDRAIINRCSARFADLPTSTRLVFTRDGGMHSSGWWKNPDYEHCLHLSLSFVDTESGENAPHDHALARHWCGLFYGDLVRLIWAEPPFSEHGRTRGVWHYRVFTAEDYRTAILPRGEVYTREFTERGWKSWSDLHGRPQESAHT